jgi:hypothetical protein
MITTPLLGELPGRALTRVRVDDDLGTVAWPNGADLDPLVLHGDFEPASSPVRH